MNSKTKPVVLGAAAVLSWSTVATAFKIALRTMSVFEMVFVATATALAIFTVWMTVTRSWGALRRLSAKTWARFAVLGLVAPVAYYIVLFSAYDYLPAQIAQPLNYLWPIILAVLLAVFGHKPIPKAKYFGMVVSLVGLIFISVGGEGISGSVSVLGIVLALGSALLWATYWIINDSLKDEVSEGTALFLTFLFGMVYCLIGSLFVPMSSLGMEAILSGAYIGAFYLLRPGNPHYRQSGADQPDVLSFAIPFAVLHIGGAQRGDNADHHRRPRADRWRTGLQRVLRRKAA